MFKFLKTTLCYSPVIVTVALMFVNQATAADIVSNQTAITSKQSVSSTTHQQAQSAEETSVHKPANTTAQSGQSPTQGYGCLTGSGNNTFQGNEAVSRYEFAAALNACLNRVNQLLENSTAERATKEDFSPLQSQLEQYRLELDSLGNRIGGLDSQKK